MAMGLEGIRIYGQNILDGTRKELIKFRGKKFPK